MNFIPAAVSIPGYQVGTWQADPGHSEIAFSVRQLLVSKVRGRFTSYDATIVTSDDPLDSSVTASLDLSSIDTGNKSRDNHLRSAAYLDVDTHPTMTYRSTGVRRIDDAWIIDGELTLRGVTRQVPLGVKLNGFGANQFGGQRAGFSATAQIDRRDFGINITLDGGGSVVGRKVSISLEIQAVLLE